MSGGFSATNARLGEIYMSGKNINYRIYDLPDTPEYSINIPEVYRKDFEKFKEENKLTNKKYYIPQLLMVIILVLVGVLKWLF